MNRKQKALSQELLGWNSAASNIEGPGKTKRFRESLPQLAGNHPVQHGRQKEETQKGGTGLIANVKRKRHISTYTPYCPQKAGRRAKEHLERIPDVRWVP